jgi:hypothetical protein
MKVLAGDWRADGTREHEVSDGSNSLIVLLSQSRGFHELQLREQSGKWRQPFGWSRVPGS